MTYFRPHKGSTRESRSPNPATQAEHILLPRILPATSLNAGLWPLDLEPEEADAVVHFPTLGALRSLWSCDTNNFVPGFECQSVDLKTSLIDIIGAQLHIWGFDVVGDFRVSQRSLALSSIYRVTRGVKRSDPLRRLCLPPETHLQLRKDIDARTVNQVIYTLQNYAEIIRDPEIHVPIVQEHLEAFDLI